MFDIKDQSYFEWPRKMEGNPATRDANLRCSYHRDHGHMTENYKTFKKFLEKWVDQRRLAKYVKDAKKAKRKETVVSDDEEEPPQKANQRNNHIGH